MKEKLLYALWGCLYVLCVGLGTVEEAEGFGKVLLILTSLIFFLPPAGLLAYGIRRKDRKVLFRLRLVAVTSLVLTLSLLIVNFLSLSASAGTGKVLHDLLLLFSAPMFCAQYWILSLFLWGCLLFATLLGRKQCVNNP